MADLQSFIDAIEKNLNKEVNLFNIEFNKILELIIKEVQFRGLQNISNPLTFDFEFQKILNELGYYTLVNNFINESYDKSYDEILKSLELVGLKSVFTKDDLSKIIGIKNIDVDFFKQVGNEASNRMKSDLNKYALSNLTSVQLADNIKTSLMDTNLAKYLTTYADTLISNYNQSIIDLKTGDAEAVYIYVGVKDKVTRKFCNCVLSQKKYYNKEDSIKLKNDKRRQYNCRHIIMPVSEQYAIDNDYVSGSFSC